MLSLKILLLCVILVAVWRESQSASLPLPPYYFGGDNEIPHRVPTERTTAARVREGVPPPLCAVRCALPPIGPLCAFDAAGTARTFATLCELEAASCRESTYYAITSLVEC